MQYFLWDPLQADFTVHATLLDKACMTTATYKVKNRVSSGNKMKLYISSTIKCTGEINTFSNTGPYNSFYMLSRSQYGHH